jgi:predicted RecB family nuclease
MSEELTIVSYSELFKWDTCQRQYYYRFGLGLRPNEESAPIRIGIKGHKLLQDFYNGLKDGLSKEKSLELTRDAAAKLIKGEFVTEVAPLLKSWTLVDNYIRETDFTANAVLVENRFLIPLAAISDDPELAHIQIGFTPDIVFERTGGMFDVEDSKFVARAWSKSKLNRFQQAKLYQIFLKRMGYNVTRSIIRFFNVTTGEITSKPYTLSAAEEATIIHDFVEAVREVIHYRAQPIEIKAKARRTMNYTACQFCAFEFPCTLEAEGKDASKTFKYEYTKSDYDYSV